MASTWPEPDLAPRRRPERQLRRLIERARGLMTTEDAAEGVRSFIERREARFTGK